MHQLLIFDGDGVRHLALGGDRPHMQIRNKQTQTVAMDGGHHWHFFGTGASHTEVDETPGIWKTVTDILANVPISQLCLQ